VNFIPISEPNLGKKEKEYILDCLDTTWISSKGKYLRIFEKKFSEYIGTKYAITCSNGTSALHLIMLALGLKEGDEVILPTLTFVASANAVSFVQAKPVFIDVEKDTWNINVRLIEKAITKKTKAIMAVHLYGHPVDLDPLRDICEEYNLFLIEDVAEAIGSEYKGIKVGSIGDVNAFSFYGNKTITTGEGGMITTNSDKLAEKINFLKDQGKSIKDKYWHEIIGYNFRMTNLQAAIGVAQMEKIDRFIKKKRTIASIYRDNLICDDLVVHPVEKKYAFNSYWMYSVVLNKKTRIRRDDLIKELLAKGIETRPFFYPMHKLPIYSMKKSRAVEFPVAEELSERGLNLPSSTKLDRKTIINVCNEFKNCIEK
jgi:perosamine synthetase